MPAMASHWVHNISPSILTLGSLEVRWYGLMYVIGFVVGGQLCKKLVDRGFFKVDKKKIDSLVTIMLISMFLGARLAYVFIYNWDYYGSHWGEILAIWQGGLSFHGAIVGFLVGGYIFAKRNGISWAQVMDVTALAGTPGIFFGRMGNFINGELYGRETTSWVGIIFPQGGPVARHPSQLYEAFAEGIILTLILWLLLRKVKYYGALASAFLIGYGAMRFGIEFVRLPDEQLGFYWGWVTMGQILCTLMVVIGALALVWVNRLKLRI